MSTRMIRIVAAAACLCLLLLAADLAAQGVSSTTLPKEQANPRPPIWPDMKVGKTGWFSTSKSEPEGKESTKWTWTQCDVRVVDVLENKTVVMRIDNERFVVKGLAAKLAKGQRYPLTSQWKVTGTQKYDGKELFVVERVARKK